ncbi:MAG: cation:proton antiporter [Bdellovibrionota bacterium]|nr:cation:proton antiporter [Bdellovibrionota bacterium]
MEKAIVAIGALFFLGHFLKWVFLKTKVPDLLILVIIGYVAGPVLGYVSPEDFGKVGGLLSTLALVVILYEGGLKLDTNDLTTSSLPAAAISILGFISIAAIAFFCAFVIAKQEWYIALLLGLGMGSTSSAVVIPMVQFLSCSDRGKTILSLESAFTDVLAIVCFLVITDGIVSNQFSIQNLLVGIGPKTVASVFLGLGFGLIWAFLRTRFSDLTSMVFASEAFALMSYGLIELSGYNGAMAVLALGFCLANLSLLPDWMNKHVKVNTVRFRELSLLAEISFLLKTVFFIYLGILIKFSSVQTVLFALLISVCIFVTRYFCVKLLFKKTDYSKKDAMVTVAMGPRGLACAVLATIPLQRGVEGGLWLQDTLFAMIPISIILTSIFVISSESPEVSKFFNRFFEGYQDKDLIEEESTNPLPES